MDTQEARVYTVVLIIILGLVIIISAFFLSIFRQQRRMRALQKAAALAELNAMEAERGRIAADLHDDMAPQLSVVKFQIDGVNLTNEEDREQLRSASNTIDELLDRLREISNNLMPVALLSKGLLPALNEYVGKVKEASGMDIDVEIEDDFEAPAGLNTNIFRMIQEIMHNSHKHAKAKWMLVRLKRRNNLLAVLIRDDGIGFDVEEMLKQTNGIGLRNIKNRAEAMNAKLQIESKQGHGTAFLFEIPLNAN